MTQEKLTQGLLAHDQMTVRALADAMEATGRMPVVLTDLDHTLFDRFTFDPQTNNHVPHISSELVAAAQGCRIAVATGRRATNPAISLLWESGLIRPKASVITENGGTVVSLGLDGEHTFRDLVSENDMVELNQVRQILADRAGTTPRGQRLIRKTGRTMLVAAMQDEQGNKLPQHQQELAAQLRGLLPFDSLRIVDTRASVTIQHHSVSKGRTFRLCLADEGISREDVFVVGMGDGENDESIFGEADFSIGFSPVVRHMVDREASGVHVAPVILTAIGRRSAQILEERNHG